MLSRVAGALYWMGRYVERAENVTRLLQVTAEASIEFEGLDEKLARAAWDDLVDSVPGAVGPAADAPDGASLAMPFIETFLLDELNHASVRHSLGKARENGRAIREALTREVFLNLNQAFHDLQSLHRRGLADPVAALDAVSRTHEAILTTLGAMEHTLSRDQGWTFLKFGEAMERTQRTLAVLRVKLPGLRGRPEEGDLPLHYARWRILLRCLASLENFRSIHGAGLAPESVVRFLLFDDAAPRSVRCGVVRMKNYLDHLPPGNGPGAARRIAGRLLATLAYDDDAIMAAPDLTPFCLESLQQLAMLHEAVEQQYFPV